MNPVDTGRWRPEDRVRARRRLGVPERALVAAWHGRVDLRRKGLDVLVAAWTRACAREPDADLRLLLVRNMTVRTLCATPRTWYAIAFSTRNRNPRTAIFSVTPDVSG